MAGVIKDSAGNAVITGDTIVENPTLYVDDANGDDANTGAAAGSGNALKTIQAGVNKLGNTFRGTATINVAAGTYYEKVTVENVSGGKLVLDGATASTTIISGATSGATTTPSRDCSIRMTNNNIGEVSIKDFRLQYTNGYGYYSDYGAGLTNLENIEIQNITGSGFRASYAGIHNCNNVDVSDVADNGFYVTQCNLNFITGASTVVNCSNDGDYSGMALRLFYGAYVGVLVAGCSFGGATSHDTYAIFMDNSTFFHDGALTLSKADVGIRARWDSRFVGTGTVTETNINTSSSLTSGSTVVNGS